MITLSDAQSDQDFEDVRQLVVEYLNWDVSQAKEVLGVELNVEELIDHSWSELPLFTGSKGCYVLFSAVEIISSSVRSGHIAAYHHTIARSAAYCA